VTRPFVLLHGFTGSPDGFRELGDRLAPRATLYTPALNGHDGTAGRKDVTGFDTEVDRLGELIQKSGLRGAHLVGYSLGARVGLGLLLRHTELFEAATLVGVHPGLDGERERAERVAGDEHWCELIEARGIEAFVDAWQAQPLFASQLGLPIRVLAEQRRQRLAHNPRGLVHSLKTVGLGRMPCYRRRMAEIDLPVTLVAGELDQKFTKLANELAELWPSAEVELVTGAGHNVLLEQPEAVHEILLRSRPLAAHATRASNIQQGRDA
jgi:2-succinyl-6-hydroxy-2,4-cyclohexadiene-1-carboxylate synthase